MLIFLQSMENEAEKSRFEQLYLRYRGLMYHIAYGILQNSSDAEDAVQQAFLAIAGHLHKIGEIDTPKTKAFAAIIVERKAIDLLRSRQAEPIDLSETGQQGIPIEVTEEYGLDEAIGKLPPKQRAYILLRFYYGYTTKEIADMMHTTQYAVQRQIWKAKQNLKKEMEDDIND